MRQITMDMWLTEVLNDETKDGPITAIQCIHKDGNREQEVFATRINQGEKLDSIQVANMFQRKAQTHVQGIAGYQQFFLYAFYAGRNEWQARLPFRVENASDVSYGTTEPPTDEGRRQQNMRHGEAGFQFFFQQSVNLAKIQNDLLRQMSDDRSKLMHESMDAVNAVKELMLAGASRQLEIESVKQKNERENRLLGAAEKYGPHLLNAVAGREVIPQVVADNGLIEGMIESLDPVKMQKIKELGFPPELEAAFVARASDYWKKKLEAETAALEAAKGRTTDPVLEDKAAE